MKNLIAALAVSLLSLPGAAQAWSGVLCNFSDVEVTGTFYIWTEGNFQLTAGANSDAGPHSIAGLCMNGFGATGPAGDIPVSGGTGFFETCSNALMVITPTRDGGLIGHVRRSTPGISQETCKNP